MEDNFYEDNFQLLENNIRFTHEQKLMLEMSLDDYKNGIIISQNDLDKSDLEWLRGK